MPIEYEDYEVPSENIYDDADDVKVVSDLDVEA